LYDQQGCSELLTLLQINIREFYVHRVTMFLRSVHLDTTHVSKNLILMGSQLSFLKTSRKLLHK